MGRLSKSAKEFRAKVGMTPVELVRHIRWKLEKEGAYDKYFESLRAKSQRAS